VGVWAISPSGCVNIEGGYSHTPSATPRGDMPTPLREYIPYPHSCPKISRITRSYFGCEVLWAYAKCANLPLVLKHLVYCLCQLANPRTIAKWASIALKAVCVMFQTLDNPCLCIALQLRFLIVM